MVPSELAKARAIDLSIQFTLFWMPFLVLLGWWIDKPMHLLFDYFELAVVLGSCFLVNYVTADSKTNWVEVRVCLRLLLANAESMFRPVGSHLGVVLLYDRKYLTWVRLGLTSDASPFTRRPAHGFTSASPSWRSCSTAQALSPTRWLAVPKARAAKGCQKSQPTS